MAATGELLKKADDDISDLVSDRGTATTREDESAAPGEDAAEKPAGDTAEPAITGEDDATAPAKKPAFRGTDETAASPGTITIRELLKGTVEVGDHDVFYVHAVTPDDRQGLWGIIQKGVTENFARGVRLTVEGRTDTYRIAVPPHADEVLDDRSSSPLGLMIHRKSRETIVYNRKLGRLTLDPDVTIYPGNELVIVGFKPEELINLYKHFAGNRWRLNASHSSPRTTPGTPPGTSPAAMESIPSRARTSSSPSAETGSCSIRCIGTCSSGSPYSA